ncbi:MAG: 3-phosphoglycerate dehydrogenase [Candidatus Thorarchaeota archaeon]|nr:MAG: 3-phosphoglycerate dehydrogenase [Candidatus Thorarchaeota archaeon]
MFYLHVLITAPVTESGIEELRASGLEVNYQSWLETGKLYLGSSLLETIKTGNYDIVIVEGDEIKEEIIEQTELKLIGSVRGSPNNISLHSATAKKIPVIAVPGRNTIAVAEHTIALMLAQARHIIAAERLLKSEFFVDDFKDFGNMYKSLMGFEISGRTVGLIGLGQIGYEVAKRLRAFNVEILVLDPYANPAKVKEVSGRIVDLAALLKNSDIITIHCPSTNETNGMLGAKEFEKMKKTAILINTARASVVDEYALLAALKNGTIAGAGLDVFSMEPVDSDNEFLELDNVTVMPHMGGNTIDTVERQTRVIVDNILAFARGEIPKNILNPEVYD